MTQSDRTGPDIMGPDIMGIDDLLAALAQLRREDLMAWIAEELVVPAGAPDAPAFPREIVVRVRLLCTLRYELEIDPDALPVVVSLLDQLHDTRHRLRALAAAVAARDQAVQDAIIATLRGTDNPA
jgi:chaperone modulatory protein CbpM